MNIVRRVRPLLTISRAYSSSEAANNHGSLIPPTKYPMLDNKVFRLPIQYNEKVTEIQQEIKNNLTPDNEILTHPDYFKVSELFTVTDLFNARVHYGHKIGSLNDQMKPYLYGARLGHTIFDLNITAEHLRKALNFAAHVAYRDGIILMFCQNAIHSHLVEKTAIECDEFSHTRRYKLNLFLNSKQIFKGNARLPDLFLFFNTMDTVLAQHPAVTEAAKLLIPTIGIVDSNCCPNLITYPVPGNDDTPAALELYCQLFKAAILRGKAKRKERLERERKEAEETPLKSV